MWPIMFIIKQFAPREQKPVLKATPPENFRILKWDGCDTLQDNSCTVMIERVREIYVKFVPTIQYTCYGKGLTSG